MDVIKAAKPRYRQIPVSPDLILHFDLDDTWIAIKDNSHDDDCTCVMIGIDEVDNLILQLQEAKNELRPSTQKPT